MVARTGVAVDDPRHPLFLQNRWGDLNAAGREMAQADRERAEKRRELAQRRQQLDELAADLRIDIAEETNGGGKPKYTNAESRAAALNKALRDNAQAGSIQGAIDALETRLVELDQHFEAYRRERQNQLALLEYAGRWLLYWSSSIHEEENDYR